jgi:hypothetical protein
MSVDLLPLLRSGLMTGYSAQLRAARCGSLLKNCTSQFGMTAPHQPTRRWSIMNQDEGNGIRANVCCLRCLKSVSHQHQLFDVSCRRTLYQVESFVFVLLLIPTCTDPLLSSSPLLYKLQ